MERTTDDRRGMTENEARATDCKAYIQDMTTGKCYVIPYGEWTVGRKDDIPLDIPIETEDGYMSRRHAVISLYKNIIGENSLYICDTLKRVNPTIVDNYSIGNNAHYALLGHC